MRVPRIDAAERDSHRERECADESRDGANVSALDYIRLLNPGWRDALEIAVVAFACFWLLLGSFAGLTSSIKLHQPDWLTDQAWLTFGRIRTVHLTAVLYGWITNAALGMIVEAGAAAQFVRLMKPMVDQTFVAHNPAVRWSLPLAIVGLFVMRGLATWVTDMGMARSGRSVVRDLRAAMMSKYLRLPNARFDREPVAALVSRLNYDTEQVTQATSEAIKVVVTDSLTIVSLLAVMLYQSVRVTLAMLVVAPLIAGISGYVGKRYRRINRGIQAGVADMAQAAEEVLSAQQEVKVYGAQDIESARYRALAQRNLRLNLKVEATRASASSTSARACSASSVSSTLGT